MREAPARQAKVAKNGFGSSERKDRLCTESQPLMDTNEHQLSGLVSIRVDSWLAYFDAREATICSKRGSPRSRSQNGDSLNSP